MRRPLIRMDMAQLPSWGKSAIRIVALLAIFYGIILLALFFGQRQLLFYPTKGVLAVMESQARGQGLEAWRNPSGQVIGWKRLSHSLGAHRQALVTHGNAGSAIDRAIYADGLGHVGNWDVYILEYPGYGARGGSPSRESLCQAADEAFRLLATNGPIYLVGESIGTGVAAWLAGTHPTNTAGVLLVAAYDDLGNVAQDHMPVFPVKWMLRDRFRPVEYLTSYHGPVAFLLAGQDEVVPNRFGRRLYDSYAGPKKIWISPNATHNTLAGAPADSWNAMVHFLKSTEF